MDRDINVALLASAACFSVFDFATEEQPHVLFQLFPRRLIYMIDAVADELL